MPRPESRPRRTEALKPRRRARGRHPPEDPTGNRARMPPALKLMVLPALGLVVALPVGVVASIASLGDRTSADWRLLPVFPALLALCVGGLAAMARRAWCRWLLVAFWVALCPGMMGVLVLTGHSFEDVWKPSLLYLAMAVPTAAYLYCSRAVRVYLLRSKAPESDARTRQTDDIDDDDHDS